MREYAIQNYTTISGQDGNDVAWPQAGITTALARARRKQSKGLPFHTPGSNFIGGILMDAQYSTSARSFL